MFLRLDKSMYSESHIKQRFFLKKKKQIVHKKKKNAVSHDNDCIKKRNYIII
jgi:hypothetical protein